MQPMLSSPTVASLSPPPPPLSPLVSSPVGAARQCHSLVTLLSSLHDSLPPPEAEVFVSYVAADAAGACAAMAAQVCVCVGPDVTCARPRPAPLTPPTRSCIAAASAATL